MSLLWKSEIMEINLNSKKLPHLTKMISKMFCSKWIKFSESYCVEKMPDFWSLFPLWLPCYRCLSTNYNEKDSVQHCRLQECTQLWSIFLLEWPIDKRWYSPPSPFAWWRQHAGRSFGTKKKICPLKEHILIARFAHKFERV